MPVQFVELPEQPFGLTGNVGSDARPELNWGSSLGALGSAPSWTVGMFTLAVWRTVAGDPGTVRSCSSTLTGPRSIPLCQARSTYPKPPFAGTGGIGTWIRGRPSGSVVMSGLLMTWLDVS